MAKDKNKASENKKVVKKKATKKKKATSKKELNAIEINKRCLKVLNLISNKGLSLRQAVDKLGISTSSFYIWVKLDAQRKKHYAHAREERTDLIFNEILTIADDSEKDKTAFVGANFINRDRLKIDARKWVLSKMNPKKYGDKIEVDQTTDVKVSFKDN